MTKHQALLLPTILLILLQNIACTVNEEVVIVEPEPQPIIVAPEPEEPYLPPKERVKLALALIGDGEQEEAKKQLRLALEEKPKFRFATQLLRQLEVDPQVFFGKAYFKYKVRPGDTLSLISARLLGNKLNFIALARYNQLEKPRNLEAGQILRIPKRYRRKAVKQPTAKAKPPTPPNDKKPASTLAPPLPPATAEPTTENVEAVEVVDELYEKAQQQLQAGNSLGAIAALSATPTQNAKQRSLLATAYALRARQLFSNKQWQEAKKALKQATKIDPHNIQTMTQLAIVESRIQGQQSYQAGQSQLTQGHIEKAYTLFKSAVASHADNASYSQALHNTGKQLANRYHRQALILYRKEQLDQAKQYWQKVLAVDPGNKIAPGYLSKVNGIQQQLLKIEKGS